MFTPVFLIIQRVVKKATNSTNPISLKWTPEKSVQHVFIFTSCSLNNPLSYRDTIRSSAVMYKLLHIGIKLVLLPHYFSGLLQFLVDPLKKQSVAKNQCALHEQWHPIHCLLTCQYTRYYIPQSWSTGWEYRIVIKEK